MTPTLDSFEKRYLKTVRDESLQPEEIDLMVDKPLREFWSAAEGKAQDEVPDHVLESLLIRTGCRLRKIRIDLQDGEYNDTDLLQLRTKSGLVGLCASLRALIHIFHRLELLLEK